MLGMTDLPASKGGTMDGDVSSERKHGLRLLDIY